MDKPNMRKLSTGSGAGYVVRTQAGFNKAIKEWLGEDDYLYRASNFKYPKSYPSVVFFDSWYEGAYYYNCECTPISEYVDRLKQQIDDLEGDL